MRAIFFVDVDEIDLRSAGQQSVLFNFQQAGTRSSTWDWDVVPHSAAATHPLLWTRL